MLEWFAVHRRDFPWRSAEHPPFIVLLTELLLQRTKASTVARFHPVLLEKYGTPAAVLAVEPAILEQDLAPLGFNIRRARSMREIASAIMSGESGAVPATETELLELHGIGRYMARAVLCFAFKQPVSIVDANVTRVFSRFFDMDATADNRRNKRLWEKGDEIIATNPDHVREINWGILDLAALACHPREPACDACPVQERCARSGGRAGRAHSL